MVFRKTLALLFALLFVTCSMVTFLVYGLADTFLKPDFSEIVSIKIFVLNEVEIIEEVTNMCNGNLEFELEESEFIEVLLNKPN